MLQQQIAWFIFRGRRDIFLELRPLGLERLNRNELGSSLYTAGHRAGDNAQMNVSFDANWHTEKLAL